MATFVYQNRLIKSILNKANNRNKSSCLFEQALKEAV